MVGKSITGVSTSKTEENFIFRLGLELGEEEDDGAFWMVVEAICTYWEEGSVNLLGKLTEEVRKKAQENDD